MGNKSYPDGLRAGLESKLNIASRQHSCWFYSKKSSSFILHDYIIRKSIKESSCNKFLTEVPYISRSANKVLIKLSTNRKSVFMSQDGAEIKKLKNKIDLDLKKNNVQTEKIETSIIVEDCYSNYRINAYTICAQIAELIQERKDFRKIIRGLLKEAQIAGIGLMIIISGRINGSTIARKDVFRGTSGLSRQTLSGEVFFCKQQAKMHAGICGVKVLVGGNNG